MSVSKGNLSISLENIKNSYSDEFLVSYYLGITKVPCIICSPLREDKNPSFALNSIDGKKIYWTDFGTKEGGDIINLLSRLWHTDFKETLFRIEEDQRNSRRTLIPTKPCTIRTRLKPEDSDLQAKIRPWKEEDRKYWIQYGITIKQLEYAEVYPISHKIIISNNKRYVFPADELAYAYVERKEGHITLKIYQPLNKQVYKWSNKHDKSVISLWTKVPKTGDRIIICSSLKDALCLWSNTGIPALALQGEGYNISNTAITELKRRFKKVYILFDNDKTGLEDGEKLSKRTGFINLVLPQFEGGKDISDYFTLTTKEQFINTIRLLIKTKSE